MAWLQNYPMGRTIFPMLRTIYHSLMREVDRTPLGLAGTINDIVRTTPGRNLLERVRNAPTQSKYLQGDHSDLNAVRPAGERLMDNIVGSIIHGLIWQQLASGVIELTGEPPDDKRERDQWQRQGKIGYGIRFKKWLGDDSHMFSYANWGPIAPGLAFIAEAEKARTRGDVPPETAWGVAGQHFAKAVTTMSFYSTLASVIDAANDDGPDDRIAGTPTARFAEDFFASKIPFVGAWSQRMGQVEDPYVRYADSKEIPRRLAQIISTKLPAHVPYAESLTGRKMAFEGTFPEGTPIIGGQKFGRETLHPQLDVWGFPVVNPFYDEPSDKPGVVGTAVDVASGVGQWVNPFRAIPSVSDPVDQELARLKEAGLDKLPARAPADYEGHKFTEDEMFEWQRRVGQDSYARLQWLFKQPEYQAAPMTGEGSKDKMIEEQYRDAKDRAWESMAIVDPGAEPQRQPKYYGIKEQASKLGIPWWQLEKQADDAISKWNDYRDALKTGRKAPTMTPDEIQMAAMYSRLHNKSLTLEQKKGRTLVKKVDDDYAPIPFTALPGIR